MKKMFTVVGVLALAVMLGACGVSMDTMKYANGTDKNIQTAECIVSIAEPAPAAVVIPVKATKIKILEPVMFNFDKSDIRADQVPVIDKVAALMAEYPDTDLVIDAYASTEGAKDYNQALSERRAASVEAALIQRGVSAERIKSVKGKGEVSIFGEILKLNRRAVVLSVE